MALTLRPVAMDTSCVGGSSVREEGGEKEETGRYRMEYWSAPNAYLRECIKLGSSDTHRYLDRGGRLYGG